MKKKNVKNKVELPLISELRSLDQSFMNSQLGWETPEYLEQNMIHKFRGYQSEALRYFHYTQVSETFKHRNIKHLLFNMATGSGKTDLMAGLILYMYKELNYCNFLFIVNTNSVLNKTIDNLTNPQSNKYLYANKLNINGERIKIERVKIFPRIQNDNTIYIKLSSVQTLATDIFTQSENSMGEEAYARNKVVVLGDEAHHYSASTKKEKNIEQSWEKAIDTILAAREDNRLLEFTATIDLENNKIYDKYQDKIIYQYALDQFILDGYSKNVKRIQSGNSDMENMLSVILLSEFRRRYALDIYKVQIKPVIMFKSQKIDASNEANRNFNELIVSLSPEIIRDFLVRQKSLKIEEESNTLSAAFNYYRINDESMSQIVYEIKREFSSNRIINVNDNDRVGMLEKGQYEALNSLESPDNLYRVVFAVAKLTEGWDVLNLYDIVRISNFKGTKGDKKTTMAEAQLIGRGARYNPLFLNGERSYKRQFDNNTDEISSLILETLHYHVINEPQYLKNLVEALDNMNLPSGEDKKNPLIDVKLKKSFTQTEVWEKGKIYYNQTIEVDDSYYDRLSKYGVDNKNDIIVKWRFTSQELGYKDNVVKEDYLTAHQIPIKIDERLLNKAMNRLRFYHFENLKKFLPNLKSRHEFFDEKWLNIKGRTLYAIVPMDFTEKDFTPFEKLEILEIYLQETSLKIKRGYSKLKGTNKFIGYPIKEYISNYSKRIPNYDTAKMVLGVTSQNVERYIIENPAFVYDSAIINMTEKHLVDRILERVDEFYKQYKDVYLIRMDENMHRQSSKNEELKLHQFEKQPESVYLEGFQPDFILYLKNTEFFMQVFIEPKGNNLVEQDQWKEDLLLYIHNNQGELIFEDEVEGVKITGLKFYTINDSRGTMKQLAQISLDKDFEGLSFY